ncbi:MAG: Transposase IS200 like protein [Candidatus Argoarchaeum ethanivorans]|uniref:Transposase IS200 like protein n=1 Tax=Candidatus Argoarchaeum ethanivorans TaxID=2608793 RepID=A0A812A1S3_9EURY|nr:MAG: Transposase IS200 like protein [Candidatus Argoarchaeum ethanivorans]
MERRYLRHDRHTVSLLTDHMVITPKYMGEILVEDVALAAEGLIRKTCREMDAEVIDMAVNVDHVHLFIKYQPKYSVSFIAKKIKGRTSRILKTALSSFERMVHRSFMGSGVLSWICWSWVGSC